MRTVIIGTGPAGITAAATLRRLDPTGSVVALSSEPYPPYSPAALADHFLTGRDQTLYWKGTDIAERLGIDERRDSVVAGVDTDAREVVLRDGGRIPYEGLVETLQPLAIDLAFLPINGRDFFRTSAGTIGNCDYREAAELAIAIGVDTAVPVHYGMFAGNTVPPGHFISYLAERAPQVQSHVLGRYGLYIYQRP